MPRFNPCSVPACTKQSKARGWCGTHYQRWLRWGSPLETKKRQPRPTETIEARIANGTEPEGDCLVWAGAKSAAGYGQIGVGGIVEYVHRVVARNAYGPCPADKEVMHSCDNRACCNPAHLSYGTRQQNVDDMIAKGRARWQSAQV